jgi:hypothetical protein
LYGVLDQAKLLNFFDEYRDERWAAGIKIRDTRDQEFKEMGDMEIYEREMPRDATPFGQQMQHFRNKVQERNDEIRELREERKRRR